MSLSLSLSPSPSLWFGGGRGEGRGGGWPANRGGGSPSCNFSCIPGPTTRSPTDCFRAGARMPNRFSPRADGRFVGLGRRRPAGHLTSSIACMACRARRGSILRSPGQLRFCRVSAAVLCMCDGSLSAPAAPAGPDTTHQGPWVGWVR